MYDQSCLDVLQPDFRQYWLFKPVWFRRLIKFTSNLWSIYYGIKKSIETTVIHFIYKHNN